MNSTNSTKCLKQLPLITYPHPILETKAANVCFPLDTETIDLIEAMWQTVREQGVGLAAPQVGVSKQICIISLSEDPELLKEVKKMNKKRGKKIPSDFVMINPEIIWQSELQSLMVEGCLSFPGEYYRIWRPANITVQFQDQKGELQVLQNIGGWLARVIQHEVDHLNGQIFTKKGGLKIEESSLTKESAN